MKIKRPYWLETNLSKREWMVYPLALFFSPYFLFEAKRSIKIRKWGREDYGPTKKRRTLGKN